MQDIVGGFKKVIQDLLVPELKAIQVELKCHSERLEAMDKRFEAMQNDMHEIKIDIQKNVEMMDWNTKMARLEEQRNNLEHILLEHIGLERKVQVA
ncbi:MAG: hypothetical protein AB1414_14075 [bacterium]